jgi:hypothetical protein
VREKGREKRTAPVPYAGRVERERQRERERDRERQRERVRQRERASERESEFTVWANKIATERAPPNQRSALVGGHGFDRSSLVTVPGPRQH